MIAASSATLIGDAAQVQDPAAFGAVMTWCQPPALRTTMSTRSKYRVPRGRVRPPVTVYGRETGPASSSVHLSSSELMAPGLPRDRVLHGEPRVRDHVLPDALDQDGHLVGDLARVGARVGQQGQAGPPPGRGDEQQRDVHLDDRLADLAVAEPLPTRPGQALRPRRERGQVICVVARSAPATCQAAGRQGKG